MSVLRLDAINPLMLKLLGLISFPAHYDLLLKTGAIKASIRKPRMFFVVYYYFTVTDFK